MLKTETFVLQVKSLNTKEAIGDYRKSFKELGANNPYYGFELLLNTDEDQKLQCFYFYVDGRIKVLMPFNLREIVLNGNTTGYFDVSSPWGYNGPLFRKDTTTEVAVNYWKAIDAWYYENKVVTEFLRFNFDNNYEHYTGLAMHTLKNVRGDISNWDHFWSNLKSNTRNQFRKAEKQGLTFELHHGHISREKLEHFYQIYIGTMDRREASDVYYHDLNYFVDYYMNNKENVAVGLVYKDDVPISSEYFLLSNDTMFSFLAGTNSDYFKLRPNEFLKINAIKWGGEFGLKYYMIGGGQADGDNLYLYKKKYFPYDEDINFYTGRKIVNNEVYYNLLNTYCPEAKEAKIENGFFPRYRSI